MVVLSMDIRFSRFCYVRMRKPADGGDGKNWENLPFIKGQLPIILKNYLESFLRGREKQKLDPFPSTLSTQMRPPSRLMISEDI